MTLQFMPALFSPVLPQLEKPLMVMLPGLDGTGKLFVSQVRGLSRYFDVRCLTIPEENRQDWPELADGVIDLIMDARQERPVYLCGESFGGCLALQVALSAQHVVQHLVLVNPASALRRYGWVRWATRFTDYVPDWLFRASGAVSLPLLANFNRISEDKWALFMETVRPIVQDCVAWRIGMLHRFEASPQQLAQLTLPTSLLASGRDRLFPSHEEARLLHKSLPNAQIFFLPESGHVCLLEDDIDLSHCLQALGSLPVALHQPSSVG